MTAENGAVSRLRDSLAAWARSDHLEGSKPGERHECFNETECRRVFAAARVEVPEAYFAEVALVFKRLPFYGGNYTLDAKRLLRPIPPAKTAPTPCATCTDPAELTDCRSDTGEQCGPCHIANCAECQDVMADEDAASARTDGRAP